MRAHVLSIKKQLKIIKTQFEHNTSYYYDDLMVIFLQIFLEILLEMQPELFEECWQSP